jgi:hypothetical protein
VADRLVDVYINFWKRSVGDTLFRFARWFMHASVQGVARIIEVDKGLQTLEVAIMRVRLHETGIRPQIYVATGWDLNFAIELGASTAQSGFGFCPVPIPGPDCSPSVTAAFATYPNWSG